MGEPTMQGTNRPGDGGYLAGAYSKLDREFQGSPVYRLREALIEASRPNNTVQGLVSIIASGKVEDIVVEIQQTCQQPKYAAELLRMLPKQVHRAIIDYRPKTDS